MHSHSSFVTLTYNNEFLPVKRNGGEVEMILSRRDLQTFLKRLRKAIEPSKIRFYAVGEYGDESERPHYHLALFGFPGCSNGNTRYHRGVLNCCNSCSTILQAWTDPRTRRAIGNIFVGDLNEASASYVAGYVTKKLTAKDDPRLRGRPPEFGAMSLKPGIGAGFMAAVAETLRGLPGNLDDAPASLQHGRKQMPLGTYLRKRLRKEMGRDPGAPPATLDAIKEEMRPLRETAFDNSRSFKKEIIKAGEQARLNRESKSKIFNRGKRKL